MPSYSWSDSRSSFGGCGCSASMVDCLRSLASRRAALLVVAFAFVERQPAFVPKCLRRPLPSDLNDHAQEHDEEKNEGGFGVHCEASCADGFGQRHFTSLP